MEFLFWNQIASFESLIVLFCVAIIAVIFLYDAYLFIARLIGVLTPRKEYVKEKFSVQEKWDNPSDEPLKIEETSEIYDVAINTEVSIPESGDNHESTTDPSPENIIEHTVISTIGSSDWSSNVILEELPETPPVEDIPTQSNMIETPIDMNKEVLNITGDSGVLDERIPISTEVASEKEIPEPENIEVVQSIKVRESTVVPQESEKSAPKKQSNTLSPEKRDKLVEITNNTRTLVARGQIIDARALIIEWLSLSKEHRELNIILAELYERDHAFDKAEYIYKDLAHIYRDDAEILLHLANSLAMQRKYRVSYELYKKVLDLQWDSEEVLYTLAHLASELIETDEVYEYSRNYIRQYPKNPEILWLYSQSQITRGNRRDAIETLIKLKNLTPYNQEIIDLIQKLVVEEEMAGNFGGEK